MTRRPSVKIGAAIVGLSVLAVAALTVRPLVWPADPDASLRADDGRLIGTAIGYVAGIDMTGRTLAVSASVIGLRPLEFRVMPDTTITIQDKQGGLGDLSKDMPVRVSYEVRDHIRLARSIELVSREITRPQPSATVEASTPPSVAAPAPAAGKKSGGREATVPVAIPAPRSEAAMPASTAPKPPAPITRRPVNSAVESRPTQGAPRDSDAGDGSAVIDWLLTEGRKR